MNSYRWTKNGMEPDVKGDYMLIKETNSMIVSVEERTIEILHDDTFSGHPSRESDYQIRNAIKFLARQIDTLHELRIKKNNP